MNAISKLPTETKEQPAFYFYPEQKYFVQGGTLQKPLNNPSLIFNITFTGQVERFISLLEKEAEKFVNAAAYRNQLTVKQLKNLHFNSLNA